MRWSAYGKTGTKNALPSHTQGGSRMPELGPYGSVRGALSNERPYRDLRNVVANYPFERSRGFPRSEPNSGHGDPSRLSCSAGDKQLRGWVLPGSSASALHGRWPSFGVAEKARIDRDLFRSENDPPAAKQATRLRFALDFPRKAARQTRLARYPRRGAPPLRVHWGRAGALANLATDFPPPSGAARSQHRLDAR